MNQFKPEPVSKVQNDRDNKTVSSILEFLRGHEENPNVIEKELAIKEDVQLKRDFHAPLPSGRTPRMKSSVYAIVSRKIRVKGIRTPKVTTKEAGVFDEMSTELLNNALEDINFNRVHKQIYERYDTEGVAPLVVREINGELIPTVVAFRDLFIDNTAEMLCDEWKGVYEGNMRWFAFRETYKRVTFNDLYPKFADKVASGSPLADIKEQYDENGVIESDIWDIEDDVEIFHCFSMMGGKPIQISIAGAGATIVEEFKDSKYKYKADNGKPYLPLFWFNFSDEKLGMYSASSVSFVKDGAEAIKKNFTLALNNAGRILDAPVYMFGSTDEADIDEIINYNRATEYGLTPVIQRREADIQLQSLAPQDVTGIFANVKAMAMDDLSERLGFQLRRQEDNPSMKVSIYVRQEQDEGDAIKAIDNRNEDVYLRLFKCLYWMKRDLVPHSKRKVSLVEGEEPLALKPSEVKELLKDYEPKWEVDTDMDNKLTFQEKVQANDIVSADIMNLYASNIQDPAVAKVVAALKYNKALMFNMGKSIKKEDFMAAATVEPPIQPEPTELTSPALPASESPQLQGKGLPTQGLGGIMEA